MADTSLPFAMHALHYASSTGFVANHTYRLAWAFNYQHESSQARQTSTQSGSCTFPSLLCMASHTLPAGCGKTNQNLCCHSHSHAHDGHCSPCKSSCNTRQHVFGKKRRGGGGGGVTWAALRVRVAISSALRAWTRSCWTRILAAVHLVSTSNRSSSAVSSFFCSLPSNDSVNAS